MVRAALAIFFVWVMSNSASATCRVDSVYLRGDWGQARFSIEIADTVSSQQLGLMNVKPAGGIRMKHRLDRSDIESTQRCGARGEHHVKQGSSGYRFLCIFLRRLFCL